MKTKILILILLFLTAGAARAHAQNTPGQILSVNPAIIDTKIERGKEQNYQITIKNLLKEPLGISSALGTFQAQDEEEINPNRHPNDLSKYSEISPKQIIIEPGKSQTFRLSVKTPKDLKEGGYYEAAFFTPFFSKVLSSNSPTVLSRVGVIVLGTNGDMNYKDLQKKTDIKSFGFDRLIYDKSQIDTVFKVSNSYFTHFNAKPFITVSPIFGNTQRYEMQDKKILPGKIRSWNERLNLQNATFFNRATLAVSVGQGNYIYKSAYFFVLPVKPILFIILITLLALIFRLRRKQFSEALRIIQKGD
jgi:hypothetical protein